jgi:hypothetical protein
MPLPSKSCTSRLGLTITKYSTSGKPSESRKKRLLRNVRSSS